jgi:tetratricopeptide (TPR) repeat protein
MATEQTPATSGEKNEKKFDFAKNQNVILGALAAVLVLVIAFVGYQQYYLPTQNLEAQNVIFGAQEAFKAGKFNEALNGEVPNYVGFLSVANDYGSTQTGKLAHYYAGLSYLNLGDFDNAIAQLQQFDGDDLLIGAYALGALGDAYSEKGDMDKAIQYYKDAANHSENELSTPAFLLKSALALESKGNNKEAFEQLTKLDKNYPNFNAPSMDVETHLARLEQKQ